MTKQRWEEILALIESGDPLKDIGVDEDELIQYILSLRRRLNLKKDEP